MLKCHGVALGLIRFRGILPADVTLFTVLDLCKCGIVKLLNDDVTPDRNKQELT